MNKREIKRGLRRTALDNLTLRTPVGHSKEYSKIAWGKVDVCWSGVEWSGVDRWGSLA